MCGLTGFWSAVGEQRTALVAVARGMADALAHRGPDDQGEWVDEAAGIALAHRRLSIVDLSAEGHQPMRSASGRFVITFNGEIYNFRELRAALESDSAAPAGAATPTPRSCLPLSNAGASRARSRAS